MAARIALDVADTNDLHRVRRHGVVDVMPGTTHSP